MELFPCRCAGLLDLLYLLFRRTLTLTLTLFHEVALACTSTREVRDGCEVRDGGEARSGLDVDRPLVRLIGFLLNGNVFGAVQNAKRKTQNVLRGGSEEAVRQAANN